MDRGGDDPYREENEARYREEYGLVERAIAGDRDALGALYERYQGRVFAVCLRLTRNGDAAEDLAQQTWASAIRTIGRYRQRDRPFGAWISTIAANACRDWARTRKATPYLVPFSARERGGSFAIDGPGDQDHCGALADPDPYLDAQARLEDAEDARAAIRAVAALPAQFRDPVILTLVEGRSGRDAAEVLGCTESNVRIRVHRGLVKLREALGAPTVAQPQRAHGQHAAGFWGLIDRRGDCWLWRGKIGLNGVCEFHCDGKHWSARRFAWAQERGLLADDMYLLNTVCRDKRCVNPAHHAPFPKTGWSTRRKRVEGSEEQAA